MRFHRLRLWARRLAAGACVLAAAGHAAESADPPRKPIPVIFDTDIESDVDDVGSVAVLHALANRGEAEILAMGVSAKFPASAPCLDALNTYFGRPDVPIGVLKGEGSLGKSKYCDAIAREFPHDLKSSATAPDAAGLYRQILAQQTDRSVVMISVGFLTNFANLLRTGADDASPLTGVELVRKKVRTWVCMGAQHPSGKEWNVFRDAKSSIYAVRNWPTKIVWSGFEIGVEIKTGAGLTTLPKSSPVRRAYELYNGITNRSSWDQTAVLFAVRGLDGGLGDLWKTGSGGCFEFKPDGSNTWNPNGKCMHTYLIRKAPVKEVADRIEALMMEVPQQIRGK